MKSTIMAGTAMALLCAAPLYAQVDGDTSEQAVAAVPAPPLAPAVPVAAPPAPQPAEMLVLKKGTPVKLIVASEVNSSSHRSGDTFALTVAEDVSINNVVVIPKGTPATAEITWRTGKGAFGKSGKIEFAMHSIDYDSWKMPIGGTYRQEGEGNTVATGVGVLAIGVFAGFITGKRARLPMGRELTAEVVQPVEFTANGNVSPAFDSAAAMQAALESTPLGQCKIEAGKIEKASKREKAIKKCYKKRLD